MKAVPLQVKVKPKMDIQQSFAVNKLLSIAKLWNLKLGFHYMFRRIVFFIQCTLLTQSGPCGEDCSYHLLKELDQWVGETEDESVLRQLGTAWGSLFCPVAGFRVWANHLNHSCQSWMLMISASSPAYLSRNLQFWFGK